MKLLKRIKNLWKLSDLTIDETVTSALIKEVGKREHQMSRIIKMTDPLEDFLKKDDVETL